jgi:hypothetical protein
VAIRARSAEGKNDTRFLAIIMQMDNEVKGASG